MRIPVVKNLSSDGNVTDVIGFLELPDDMASAMASGFANGLGWKIDANIIHKEHYELNNVRISGIPEVSVLQNDEFKMPVLKSGSIDEKKFLSGFPDYVMLPHECEKQAKINTRQSLERLAERGGLAPDELVAVMEGREWRRMDVFELVDAFRKYHWV